jgi:hypothetical protein
MALYAYARYAIDFWDGWLTQTEYLARLRQIEYADIAKYESFKDAAFELASTIGWEGDVRGEPYVAGLPGAESGDDHNIMIAWKQDNNGDTFVVSPFELPYLKEEGLKWAKG